MREQAQAYTLETIQKMSRNVRESAQKMSDLEQKLHECDLKLFEALNKVTSVDKRID